MDSDKAARLVICVIFIGGVEDSKELFPENETSIIKSLFQTCIFSYVQHKKRNWEFCRLLVTLFPEFTMNYDVSKRTQRHFIAFVGETGQNLMNRSSIMLMPPIYVNVWLSIECGHTLRSKSNPVWKEMGNELKYWVIMPSTT